MKGRSKILSALLAAALFVGATIPALAAGATGGEDTKGMKVTATVNPSTAPEPTVGTYTVGEAIKVTPGADNTSYRFREWTPATAGTTNTDKSFSVTYKAGESVAIVANYDVKVTVKQPTTGGTVTIANLPTDGFVNPATEYTVTAAPAEGYTFGSWGGITGSGAEVKTTFSKPTEVSATFVKNDAADVTVTIKAGTGITSVSSASIAGKPGESKSFTFVLTDGYENPTATLGKVSGTTVTFTMPDKATEITVSATKKQDPGTDPTTPEEPTTVEATVAVDGAYWVELDGATWTADNDNVTLESATTGCKIIGKKAGTSTVTAKVGDKVVMTVKVTVIVIDETTANVAEEISNLESVDAIKELSGDQASKKLGTTLTGVTAENAETVADQLAATAAEEDIAKLDALMEQSNGVTIDGAKVNVTVEAPKADGVPPTEQVTDAPKFTGLSLLAIKKRAEVTMTPKQEPKTTKFSGLTSANLVMDLQLKVNGKTYKSGLPRSITVELVVPEGSVKLGNHMTVFHGERTGRGTKTAFRIGTPKDGKATLTFKMGQFSYVVFSDEEYKAPASSTSSYRGGGGGGAGFSSYVITATAGAGGTISSPGETRYNAGTSVTYTITPNAGYVVDKVLVDGKKEVALTNGTYTFRLLDQPYTISATFKPVSGGTAAQPSAPAAAAPNPSTGDSWFSHLFF